MKFGIALQWSDNRHMGLSPILIEVAKYANEVSFSSLWVSDKITSRSDPDFSNEPLITLASLMHIVPEMQLGVSVLVLPQRSAPVVAKQAATLSLLSDGRFILGVGAGWSEEEYALLNTEYATRGRKMDESIAVMQRLWSEDEAAFQGQFYRINDVTMYPPPHGGRVPLWIGGNSPAAIRRAARVGDAWLPAALDVQGFRTGVEQLREYCGERPLPTLANMVYVDASLAEDGSGDAHIGGSVEQMVTTLREYEQVGLEHLVCVFTADNLRGLQRQIHNFSEYVMPSFIY